MQQDHTSMQSQIAIAIDQVSDLARNVCVTHTREAGLPEYLQAQATVLALQRI